MLPKFLTTLSSRLKGSFTKDDAAPPAAPSEYVELIRVNEIRRHENAERLELVKVYDREVVVKKGDFAVGDLAVFVPLEFMVPFEPYWEFIHRGSRNVSSRKVRAARLRGIFSYGLLCPVTDFPVLRNYDLVEGMNVGALLGIVKYEPPQRAALERNSQQQKREKPEFIQYTDIKHFWREGKAAKKLFNNGGRAFVITEKLHGANFRAGLINGSFFVGSHYGVKFVGQSPFVAWLRRYTRWFLPPAPERKHYYDEDVWTRAAIENSLEERLREYKAVYGEELILFGEIVGPKIQKGFHYGIDTGTKLYIFDIYSRKDKRFLSPHHYVFRYEELLGGLEIPWSKTRTFSSFDDLEEYAEHLENCTWSTITVNDKSTMLEGFVIRPAFEYADDELNPRPIWKIVTKQYLEKA